MVVLFGTAFGFFIVLSIVDGYFTAPFYGSGDGAQYDAVLKRWLLGAAVLLITASLGFGAASLLGDTHHWSREDYFGVFVLAAQPWILMWSGFLDFISRSVQGLAWGESLFGWIWKYTGQKWPWLDPPATQGVPTLPYLLSQYLFSSASTVTMAVVLGSTAGILIVLVIWKLYSLM